MATIAKYGEGAGFGGGGGGSGNPEKRKIDEIDEENVEQDDDDDGGDDDGGRGGGRKKRIRRGETCGECGKMIQGGKLKRHMDTVHSSGSTFPCSRCQYVYANQNALDGHVGTRTCQEREERLLNIHAWCLKASLEEII